MKNKILNIALIFLFGLAFFQTYRLWFVNLSNDANSQNQITIDSNIKEDLVKPFRLSVEMEKNQFNSYFELETLSIYNESKNLFKTILKNGSLVDDFNREDYTDLVIYNYNFVFEEDYFKEALNQNKSRVSINSFDNIFIYFKKEGNYAVFYNSIQDTSTIITFGDKSFLTTLSSYKKPNNVKYYSEDLIKFTANWDEKLEYEEITYSNPYSLNGEIHISSVENMVNSFFQNPLSKTQSIQNETNAITFNDNNTIVRYYPNNIFEYKYYYVYESNKNINFVDYFTLATNFILNDTAIDNTFYLDDYKIENNEVIFYFNYSIGNFPILLSENYKAETNINSFIEIAVSNNVVTDYKKIPYNFKTSNSSLGNLTYNQAITGLGEPSDNLLAYKMDESLPISLYWFLYYDESEFTTPFTYN